MIKKEEVQNLAELARIQMGEKELLSFTKDFEEILAYVSSLQNLKTEHFDESVLDDLYPKNVFRDDTAPHTSKEFTKKILAEAPKIHEGYIQVDKILNQE